MSVQVNQYICYGYLLPYKEAVKYLEDSLGENEYEEFCDKYYDSAFNENIREVYGCSMIFDGMDGRYVFFGKIYAKSVDHRHLQSMILEDLVTTKDEIIVEHEFGRIFGDFAREDYVAKLQLITHYR